MRVATEERAGRAVFGFRHLSLRRRLSLLMVAVGAIAVLIEFGGVLWFRHQAPRSEAGAEAAMLANMVSTNLASAAVAEDPAAAEKGLTALASARPVLAATLRDNRGQVLAEYRSPRLGDTAGSENGPWTRDALRVEQSVFLNRQRAGSLTLVVDTGIARARLTFWLGIVFTALIASVAIWHRS